MGQIITKHGEVTRLARDFKVSRVTVWSALNEATKSPLSRAIRKAALEGGGMEKETEVKRD